MGECRNFSPQRVAQSIAQGSVFGGMAAVQGASPSDIISNFAQGFGYGLTGKPYGAAAKLYDETIQKYGGFKEYRDFDWEANKPKPNENYEQFGNRFGNDILYKGLKEAFKGAIPDDVIDALAPVQGERYIDYYNRTKATLDQSVAAGKTKTGAGAKPEELTAAPAAGRVTPPCTSTKTYTGTRTTTSTETYTGTTKGTTRSITPGDEHLAVVGDWRPRRLPYAAGSPAAGDLPEAQHVRAEQGGRCQKAPKPPATPAEPPVDQAMQETQQMPVVPEEGETLTPEEFNRLSPEAQKAEYERVLKQTEMNQVTQRPGIQHFKRTFKKATENYTKPVWVAQGDINGFKEYNDRILGSSGTDDLNRTIYDRIASTDRSLNVSNIHGDEYIITGSTKDQLEKNIKKAMEDIAAAGVKGKDGKNYKPTMSWKIAQAKDLGEVGNINAKEAGKNQIVVENQPGKLYTISGAESVKPEEIVRRQASNENAVSNQVLPGEQTAAPAGDLGRRGPQDRGTGRETALQPQPAGTAGESERAVSGTPAPAEAGRPGKLITPGKPSSFDWKKYPDLTEHPEFNTAVMGYNFAREITDKLKLSHLDNQYLILTGKRTGILRDDIQKFLTEKAEKLNRSENIGTLAEYGLENHNGPFGAQNPVHADDIRAWIADAPKSLLELDKVAKGLQKGKAEDEEKRIKDEDEEAAAHGYPVTAPKVPAPPAAEAKKETAPAATPMAPGLPAESDKARIKKYVDEQVLNKGKAIYTPTVIQGGVRHIRLDDGVGNEIVIRKDHPVAKDIEARKKELGLMPAEETLSHGPCRRSRQRKRN